MQPLCHWCNRQINSDELIIVIVPRSYDDTDEASDLSKRQESAIEEQPWHTVCFGVVQGAPSAED